MDERITSLQLDVVVLSIDVLLDPVRADLQDPQVIQRWLDYILAGKVCGLSAGPPCETWSRVRGRKVLCCDRWLQPGGQCGSCRKRAPRPLRTQQRLWGMTGLTKHEQRQLKLANGLYRTTLQLALACHTMEVPFLIEHPEPTEPGAPSSWHLPETSLVAQMDKVEIIDFDQCTMGAAARKPTRLMVGHLPGLSSVVRSYGNSGRCDHRPTAHRSLQGLDAPGSWKTAPAKVYPTDMCRAIANAMITTTADHHPHLHNRGITEWDECAVLYQPWDHYLHLQPWGADNYDSNWVV